jgi:hypothetical protein
MGRCFQPGGNHCQRHVPLRLACEFSAINVCSDCLSRRQPNHHTNVVDSSLNVLLRQKCLANLLELQHLLRQSSSAARGFNVEFEVHLALRCGTRC